MPPASAISALGFIVVATVRNMLRRQLRRVREPRYLIATLIGAFYLVNVFFQPGLRAGPAARVVSVHDGGSAPIPPLKAVDALTITLRGEGLAWVWMLFILFGWLFGGDESGLSFSDPEIQFLFPAPLTRRQLVHYKLVRSLLFAVISALVLTLTVGRGLKSQGPLFVLGAFLGVATLSLHLVAASLTRLSLLQRGLRGSSRRALALVIPAAIVGSVVGGLIRVPLAWPTRWPEVRPYFAQLFATAPLSWASAPFAPAARVALARTASDLWPWLPAAVGVLAVHYLWALSTGVSFEQASIASAERRARRVEGMRRDQLTIRATARPPWALSSQGSPAVAVYWKNLTAAVRVLSLRVALVVVLPAFIGGVAALAGGAGLNQELGAVVCAVLAVSTAFFGVQVYRIDFRLDLAAMEILKSFPLRGVHLAVAEVMAPFTVLTLAEWLLLGGAAILAPASVVAPVGRLPLAATAMLLFPAFTLPGLLVQNAAALLFPAWVESGAAPPRGVEAIGQRMLTLVGTLLAVTLALVPAALVGGAVGGLLYRPLGSAALPIGALAGTLVVAAESALAFLGLGRAFERFDPGRP